jgi:hypothetical protein
MAETFQLYVKNTSNCEGLSLQTLERLGPEEEHFATAAEYPVNCVVSYVLSQRLNSKGKPYKDIISVRAA